MYSTQPMFMCRRPYIPFIALAWLLALLAYSAPVLAQMGNDPSVRTPFSRDVQTAWLHEVLPGADLFSEKEGEPPVYRGYRVDPASGQQELVGFAFLSADVPPEERGYSAPIDMLIGLDLDNMITGLKILHYVESYVNTRGDFLAHVPFLSQFRGKSIRDDFRLQRDIDGIANATVSTFAISRGARNAARQVAAAYLGFQIGDPVQQAADARVLEQLRQYSWEELLDMGMVHQLVMPVPGGDALELTITYMGRPVLGEFWIGNAYARAERDASAYLGGQEMILVAVGGSAYTQFRQDRLTFSQDGSPPRRLTPNRFVTAGNADEGMLDGRAQFAGAIVVPENLDILRPITIAYQPLGSLEPYSVEFLPVGLGMALAMDEPVLSDREIERILRAQNSFIAQLRDDPPWGVTPWGKVLMLLLLLSLVMASFLKKSARLRWVTLGVTLVYLGFIDGGFLSVSHITGALMQGPSMFLNNLPLLIIVTFTVVTTLLWGRVFCSSLCPFGAVQDLLTRIVPKRWQRTVPQHIHNKALYLKYGFLLLIVGAALLAGNVALFQYLEPFGTLFFLSGSLALWLILFAILAASAIIPRFYCRYMCPLGAGLAVASLASPLRIKRVPQCSVCSVCEHACPVGAIRREYIDFKECVRCDICESKLIRKAGSCQHEMGKIILRHKELQPR